MTTAKLATFAMAAFAGLTTATVSTHASILVSFSGGGVSGNLSLTFSGATDQIYSSAYEVTGISGTFTDNNIGIVGATVSGLFPIDNATPESGNLLAPYDFSRFPVASGLPAASNGNVTYDNLFWPGGSPQTGSDYPFGGGFLDIYGLMFTIGGGEVVNLWSNGTGMGYGVGVATSANALDYLGYGNVTASATPEPAKWAMALIGFASLGFAARLAGRRSLASA
jgi:hypothetical protein